MPTGLQVNNGFAQMGNINIQAIKPQSEASKFGTLNVADASIVGVNKVVSTNSGNIFQNSTVGIVPTLNQFQSLLTTIPPLQVQAIQIATFNVSSLILSPIALALFLPAKLRGISEQRPEIISLSDFSPIYARRSATEMSDVGDFLNTSMAARKIRFDHIETLVESIQEVEDANKILNKIAGNYAAEVDSARNTIKFMRRIARLIKNSKESLDIRNSDNLKNDKFAGEATTSLSYREFLVEQYGFSDSGFENFSNTKIVGQFFNDIRKTLGQYSPTLFGTNDPLPPGGVNTEAGFEQAQPSISNTFFNANGSLGQATAQSVERSADRDFGNYNAIDNDLTDNQFDFQVRLFKNAGFSLLGTPFNQFLDLLPGNNADRTTLLLMTLSKELRISSGLSQTGVQNLIFNKFGGNDSGDPFDFVIGQPGDTIAEPVIGGKSLCSLLRYENENGDIVLPFESTYVKGEDGNLYLPGSKELVDSIIQSEDPYNTSKLKKYQKKLSNTSTNAVSVIRKLLDVGKNRPRIKPIDLYNEMGRDYIEMVDLLRVSEGTISLPGSWGEASLLKLAFGDRQIKQLLFQYVLTLGMLGKPSGGEFGDNSVEPFFREMSDKEITTWNQLPIISQDKNLGSNATQSLKNVLDSFGIENVLNPDFATPDSDILGNNSTGDTVNAFTSLAFIAEALIAKAKQKGDQNENPSANNSVINSVVLGHLVSTKNLIIFNRMADFIATIAKRAANFTEDDGRTRFNRLNLTTMAAFAFEAYMSFLDPLFSGISEPNTDSEVMSFTHDIESMKDSQTLIRLLIGNFGSYAATLSGLTPKDKFLLFASLNAQALSTPAGNTQVKLIREEEITAQIMGRIKRTFELVEITTGEIVDFLDTDGINSQNLIDLIEVQGGKERVAMINEAQFVLARKALKDFNSGEGVSLFSNQVISYRKSSGTTVRERKTRVRNSKQYSTFFMAQRIRVKTVELPVFVDGSMISLNEKKLLDIVLKRPKFRGRRASNMKILTVGIPAGFGSHLIGEIGLSAENASDVLDKEKDVIAINVYRRSVDFEDIVFKPKTYLFETSRFIIKSELERVEIEENRFRDFLGDRSIEFMRDYSDRPRGNRQSQEAFFENEDYNFLTTKQKKKLVINHLESYVLGIYLQLLTGISTDENEYLVDDSLLRGFIDDTAQQDFTELVSTYVKGVVKQPVSLEMLKQSSPQVRGLLEKIEDFRNETNFTEQITPPELPGTTVPVEQRIELTEDLINFVKLYNPKSLFTGGKIQALRITSPKLFERILNLAVDPDDFEIDMEKTFLTKSGKRMFDILQNMDLLKISKTSTKIKERNKNRTISLDQFFVNVSTVGNSE